MSFHLPCQFVGDLDDGHNDLGYLGQIVPFTAAETTRNQAIFREREFFFFGYHTRTPNVRARIMNSFDARKAGQNSIRPTSDESDTWSPSAACMSDPPGMR